MSKPMPTFWKLFLSFPIIASLVLFQFSGSSAETPAPTDSSSPISSESPTASPSPSDSPSPSPSVSPSPSTSASPSVSASPTVPPSPSPSASTFPRLYPLNQPNSLWVVVNKKRRLNPVAYAPILSPTTNLAKPAATAYWAMRAEIKRQGLGTLCLNSGYRSYSYQKSIHSARVASMGKTAAEQLAARPGHSEHQTGLAADVSITSLDCRIGGFGSTQAYKWIASNGYKYGFIVRYPLNKTDVTGYVWEPWHLRFVGKELAAEMRKQKVKTLEEFFKLPAAPTY